MKKIVIALALMVSVKAFCAPATSFPAPGLRNPSILVGSGGVTANKLVKTDTTGQAVVAITTSDTQIYGVAETTTASGSYVAIDQAGSKIVCAFDAATTTNDFVQISPTAAASCHDSGVAAYGGATAPTGTIGIVNQTIGSAGTAQMQLFAPTAASSASPNPLSGMTATQVPIAATSNTVTSSIPIAGAGLGLVSGPTTATATDLPVYTSTTGGQVDSGILIGNVCLTAGTHCPSSGISGLTIGQVPIAGSSTTLTSSIPLSAASGTIPVNVAPVTSGDVPKYNGAGSLIDTGINNTTLVTSVSTPGAGVAHFAGGTQNVTSSSVALSEIVSIAANTFLANVTSGSASPTAASLPSCSTSSSALLYTTATGISCNTSINANSVSGYLAPSGATILGTSNGTYTIGSITQYSSTTGIMIDSGIAATSLCLTAGTHCPTSIATATNLAGGALGSLPCQSAAGTTTFVTSPTTSGNIFFDSWSPSGSAVACASYNATANMPFLASANTFTSTSGNTFSSGSGLIPVTLTGSGSITGLQLLNTSGGATHNYEFFTLGSSQPIPGFGIYDLTSNTLMQVNGGGASPFVATGTGGVLGFFVGTSIAAAPDTGMSRDSASVIDFGNGTAGNKSGSIKLAGITNTGTTTLGSAGQTTVSGAGNIVSSGGMDNTIIGATTKAAANFTTLTASTSLTINGGAAMTNNQGTGVYVQHSINSMIGPGGIDFACYDAAGDTYDCGFSAIAPASIAGIVGSFVSRNRTTALTSTVLATTNATALYRVAAYINCDGSTAAATVTLTFNYIDPSGTAQALIPTAAACTTLGSGSVSQLNQVIGIKTGTSVTETVAIAGSPTYDVATTVEQLTTN